jgi:hypothetical protein
MSRYSQSIWHTYYNNIIHNTIQCNAYNTIQYNTIQYNTILSALVAALAEFLLKERDINLDKISPLSLAQEMGVDEDAMVGVFIRASAAGFLKKEWSLACVWCNGASRTMDKV